MPRKKLNISYGTFWISRKRNFKNRSFSSGQGVVQIKPNSAWSITSIIKMQNKKNCWCSLPRKKISISYGTFWISRKMIFKNRSFLSGQEVVQIKPNLVWSIPRVGRFWDEKNCPRKFSKKSSYFNRESRLIRLLFAYSFFKNIEILSGQGCVQIKPNSAWSITSVIRM